VVGNADAAHVYRDLLPTPDRLAKLADRSLAGFVVLLGLRDSTGGAHHTVFFPGNYDAEFDAVFNGRIANDPTVFVTNAADDAVRPPGHEAWFVLVNAAPQGRVDWTVPGRADAYADRILDLLAQRATTSATACCSGRSAPPPTCATSPEHRAAPSTGPPRTA
jgi:phytoene dehydrogenase-like protein